MFVTISRWPAWPQTIESDRCITAAPLETVANARRDQASSFAKSDATIAAMRGSSDHRRARVARGQSDGVSLAPTHARRASAIMWN